jgi:hypothetical protein
MAQSKPASPRSIWGAGFVLGGVLLAVAYFTWFNVHNLWEIPVGLYLVVMCMGKVVAR